MGCLQAGISTSRRLYDQVDHLRSTPPFGSRSEGYRGFKKHLTNGGESTPVSPLAASFLRCAPDRFHLTKPNTFQHNREPSVAILRWCSGSSRTAVRLSPDQAFSFAGIPNLRRPNWYAWSALVFPDRTLGSRHALRGLAQRDGRCVAAVPTSQRNEPDSSLGGVCRVLLVLAWQMV